MPDMVCPHCGCANREPHELVDDSFICELCGKIFYIKDDETIIINDPNTSQKWLNEIAKECLTTQRVEDETFQS